MQVPKMKKGICAALGTAAALLTMGASAFAQITYGAPGMWQGQSPLTYGSTNQSPLTYGDYGNYGNTAVMNSTLVVPQVTYDGPVATRPVYQVIAQQYDANMDVCDARTAVYNYYAYNVYSYNSYTASLIYQGQQYDGPYFQGTVDTSYSGPCQ